MSGSTPTPRVEIQCHDLNDPLPDLGEFGAVVSSFAIHHVDDARKREVYAEAFAALRPGGVFLNLEHVASTSDRLHRQFRVAIGHGERPDDPSNQLTLVGPPASGWLTSASRTWTAIGSGSSWPYWLGSSRSAEPDGYRRGHAHRRPRRTNRSTRNGRRRARRLHPDVPRRPPELEEAPAP